MAYQWMCSRAQVSKQEFKVVLFSSQHTFVYEMKRFVATVHVRVAEEQLSHTWRENSTVFLENRLCIYRILGVKRIG